MVFGFGGTPGRLGSDPAAVVVSTKKFVTSHAHRLDSWPAPASRRALGLSHRRRQGFDPIRRHSCGYPSAMLKSVRL